MSRAEEAWSHDLGVKFTRIEPPEKSRIYHYKSGEIFKIENVSEVGISESGGHRITTTDGRKFIPSRGWLAIELEVDRWTL